MSEKENLSSLRKVMISQPMNNKNQIEIIEVREKAIEFLRGEGYEIVNTFFTDDLYNEDQMKKMGVVNIPLSFLAKTLENMSLCNFVYFCRDWEKARGCLIEHEVAKKYGLKIIYEEK